MILHSAAHSLPQHREQRLQVDRLVDVLLCVVNHATRNRFLNFAHIPSIQASLERKERQMQETQSRREMKQQRRSAAQAELDQLHSIDTSSVVESIKQLSIAESSFTSESAVSELHMAEAAPNPHQRQHHDTVSKNRQKQLQRWAAARPSVPIASSYFTSPVEADLTQRVSPTRVLLSGLGADELCGGYARYRTAHHRGGDAAARASMKADVDRIWLRNLGRDDR